jgi:hypothetical protein
VATLGITREQAGAIMFNYRQIRDRLLHIKEPCFCVTPVRTSLDRSIRQVATAIAETSSHNGVIEIGFLLPRV